MFNVEHAMAVTGGHLKHPELIEYELVNGCYLFKASKRNRVLAKICDFKGGKMPFPVECDALDYLRDARNEAIDALMQEQARSDDPMADDDVQSDLGSTGKCRSTLFTTLKVPDLINVKLPAFKSKSGDQIDEIYVRMLATPVKSASALVEIKSPTLAWLKAACTVSWKQVTPKRKACAASLGDLGPNVTWPESIKLQIIRNDATHLRIAIPMKVDGKWTKVSRTIRKDQHDADGLQCIISSNLNAMVEQFEELHEHDVSETEGADATAS